jgi:hypothetical protein
MEINENGFIEHEGKTYYPEEAMKAAFMLGVQSQKALRQADIFSEYLLEKFRRKVELVCQTNRRLLDEILRLDEIESLTGVGITVDRDFIRNIIKELRDNNNKSGRANLLQSQINKYDQDWNKIFNNIEKEMRDAIDG